MVNPRPPGSDKAAGFWAGPLLIVAAALLVPVLPFLLAGGWIEPSLAQLLSQLRTTPTLLAAAVVAVLATDVFLPVPSSLVAALAGQTLGPITAVVCVWLGMTLSAIVGYALARLCGPPLAQRWIAADRLRHIEAAHRRYGARLLAVTRPLPILAEAYVLLAGAHRFPLLAFVTVVALSNLVIAGVFVLLGVWSAASGWTGAALAISVAVPLMLTVLLERCAAWRRPFRLR